MHLRQILVSFFLMCLASSVSAQDAQTLFNEAEEFHDRRLNAEAQARYILVAFDEDGAPAPLRATAFFRLSEASVMSSQQIALLDQAAQLGNNRARVHLARLIYQEVERNANQFDSRQEAQSTFSRAYARELLEAAVADGAANALLNIAGHYRRGELGLLQDPDRAAMLENDARELLLARSNNGDPEAMILLASLLSRGIGGETDAELAVVWEHRATEAYRSASEEGDIAAMRLLFRRYASGLSAFDATAASDAAEFWARELVRVNPTRFDVTWLAYYYREGRGFPHDLSLAHAIYNVSAAMFDDAHSARQRDAIGQRLSADEQARALSFARTCMDIGFEQCLEGDRF